MEGMKMFEDEKRFLEGILQKTEPGCKISAIDGSAACKVGDNYMSNVSRYCVSVESGNNNIGEMNILVKKIPSNPVWREAFECDLGFRNEANSYNVVLPIMKKFIGEDNLAFPRCLYASEEYTVLEDLKPLGFNTVDRRLGLDFEHTKVALKELGRFHGTSLAMKHSQPKVFEYLTTKVQEIVFRPEKKEILEASFLNGIRLAAVGLKVYHASGIDSLDATIKKVQDLKDSVSKELFRFVQQKGPLSVVCHGDCYLNNMMFNYTESGEVSEAMLVDLQIFRYGSLSLDLLHFLTTSLRPGVMSSHFDQLLETYHTSLDEQLQKFAPTAPPVSLIDIYDEIRSHSSYGLFMGLIALPFVTALPGTTLDMEKEMTFTPEEYFKKGLDMLSPEYFRRIKQLFKDYEAFGYL